MLRLKREKSFIKDFAKRTLNDSEFERLAKYLSLLCEGKPLPEEAREHELKGEWLGFREFHIGSDKLVIYKIYNQAELKLIRLGTHSQLFK
ncbi:type II toxin-antitoxin system YafQ family toxin [Helicobacter sp. MIT 14-3879]|uniref:type II toxin-antitoxin system RelE/ParE family toxin n=1 Tax=Helicobacter sp. MIT 14-3879 TaxID=2040649 RepID=UPI000E1EC61F|nr:type II toxin-antitoxin system YafQ family toxin [Helicobacter sp. MIT 14-3879]RDU60646.1 type II toxin-antitoxin system mRNA interferase toxin, RelE/StbE family [Helicobacter sp. MIT 14-3879]